MSASHTESLGSSEVLPTKKGPFLVTLLWPPVVYTPWYVYSARNFQSLWRRGQHFAFRNLTSMTYVDTYTIDRSNIMFPVRGHNIHSLRNNTLRKIYLSFSFFLGEILLSFVAFQPQKILIEHFPIFYRTLLTIGNCTIK